MSSRILSVFVLSLVLLLATGAFAAEPARYQRTIENYVIPDVVLTNQDGQKVRFKQLLESDKPVAVDFIYATCTTICPILSAGYANLQRKLGADSDKVHLVSITIDPENDTPALLKKYLTQYSAKPGWDFLTGSRNDINRVMIGLRRLLPRQDGPQAADLHPLAQGRYLDPPLRPAQRHRLHGGVQEGGESGRRLNC